ncbi:MBOAT family protein [Alkalibaculum sp. M08DMB]|uniref:MBOAT family protein n=1 Tax=Alkalibaculum sporogenes TaxID=2655001 RepID=A0A6A7KBH5_9FIRM|nr:MBOAT family O-acyltransferase [Alkalibaculum sporogenes]MPW26756.1 MBOAT family protein [Alkalibaculum sporogenes]
MLFTSYSFLIFIALLFVIYYTIPKKYQWKLLLFASYLFYAFAGVKFLGYILLTTISVYLVSHKIDKLHQMRTQYLSKHKGELSREEKKEYKLSIKAIQWKWLLFTLFINFGILAVLKYTNFTIANINYLTQAFGNGRQLSFWNLALPMGISFYTFQTMGYIIDVYRGKYAPEKNLFKLALFVSFFPQLIQGPISRFDDLSKTLFKEKSFNNKSVNFGLQRIMWGFFKKVVIADRILIGVTTIVSNPDTYQGVFVFVGMLFYALQLYADFTGGIDITLGIAEVLGIKVQENFNRPYFSKSIKEFWRRWHITLGTWFKEYLFYPISVCRPMLKLSKFSRRIFGDAIGKRIPVYLATLVVWFTTGIWHGSSWNFVVWGLMNSLVILVSQEFEPLYERFHNKFKIQHTFGFRSFQVARTILLMSSLRLFDCYRDVPLTFKMFGTMFTNYNVNILFNGDLMNLGLSMADYIVLLMGLVLLLTVSLIQRNGSVRSQLEIQPLVLRYAIYYSLIIAVIILGAYGVGYDSSQFIYNQF